MSRTLAVQDSATRNQGPRIIQVASDLGPSSGSVLAALPRLCSLLEESGCQVDLLCTDERDGPACRELRNGFDVACFPKSRFGKSLGRSPSLNSEIRRLSSQSDLLHVHGLWRLSGVYALEHARRRKIPAIVSPLGTLASTALRISRLRKRMFWAAFQQRSLRGLACYHAASRREHDQLREFGLRDPVAVIPLGVDIPTAVMPKPVEDDRRIVLFVGRISPIKNLLSLVSAWRSIQADFPSDSLRIVGPDDRGHRNLVRRKAREIGAVRVSIESEITGPALDQAYGLSDVVILPSLSESFGLVVPEALAAGRPVIATAESPWQVLVQHGCGWSVDPTNEAIAGAMREALSLPRERLAEMGQRGRELAIREFSWPQSAVQFVALYEWVVGGGAPPDFVSI